MCIECWNIKRLLINDFLPAVWNTFFSQGSITFGIKKKKSQNVSCLACVRLRVRSPATEHCKIYQNKWPTLFPHKSSQKTNSIKTEKQTKKAEFCGFGIRGACGTTGPCIQCFLYVVLGHFPPPGETCALEVSSDRGSGSVLETSHGESKHRLAAEKREEFYLLMLLMYSLVSGHTQ